MATFYRCNRMAGALSLRNGNATASLFSVFFSHYHTTNVLLHIDSARAAKDWKARPGESCLRSAGRIGEVPVPASRPRFFTSLYSHLRRSTEILPCGAIGCRRYGGTP